MIMMSRRAFLLLAVTALALVSPSPLQGWGWKDSALQRVPLPAGLHLVSIDTSADLDGDGKPESLTLLHDQATIRTGDQIRWESPAAWQVAQAQISDLNRDGAPEAVLLVWRHFRPWPVDAWLPYGGRIEGFHDSGGFSCHIILIGWKQGAFREVWAGSAMADPVQRFAVADLAGDGQPVLVTLEGSYEDPPSAPSRRLSMWEWNGFGFTFVHELEDAHAFSLMGIAQIEDRQVLILSP
jgi:hypothetical protein